MGTNPSWRLAPGCRDQAQALIVSGFTHLPAASALFLDASAASSPAWLGTLLDQVAITPAVAPVSSSAAIAFTASGLRCLGLPEEVLAGFDPRFLEGMHESDRRQRLGDDNEPDAPLWGGNGDPWPGTTRATCSKTVHAILLLYGADAAALALRVTSVTAILDASGVVVSQALDISLPPGDDRRETFGFADGISQPIPWGDGIVTPDGIAAPRHPVHGIAAGDILLGHLNAHGEPAPGPVIPAHLFARPECRRLGDNGSYLVIRQLSQNADAFWAGMATAANAIGAPSAKWLAERAVGRTQAGVALAASLGDNNDFLYSDHDAVGRLCPLGAHIRRANPRDSQAPTPQTIVTELASVNTHRILRRGRSYVPDPNEGGLPGLLFMCLNTDIQRQFEFVQQSWLLNPAFAALFDERDPLIGTGGMFTVPDQPIRRRASLPSAIRFVGGEYFFLPSLPALDYLAGSF